MSNLPETQPQRWERKGSVLYSADDAFNALWVSDLDRLVSVLQGQDNAVATLRAALEYIAKWGDSGMKQVAERALEATKETAG